VDSVADVELVTHFWITSPEIVIFMELCGWMQFQFLNQPKKTFLSLSLSLNTVGIHEGKKVGTNSCFNILKNYFECRLLMKLMEETKLEHSKKN
jgi:hypothetical protein